MPSTFRCQWLLYRKRGKERKREFESCIMVCLKTTDALYSFTVSQFQKVGNYLWDLDPVFFWDTAPAISIPSHLVKLLVAICRLTMLLYWRAHCSSAKGMISNDTKLDNNPSLKTETPTFTCPLRRFSGCPSYLKNTWMGWLLSPCLLAKGYPVGLII